MCDYCAEASLVVCACRVTCISCETIRQLEGGGGSYQRLPGVCHPQTCPYLCSKRLKPCFIFGSSIQKVGSVHRAPLIFIHVVAIRENLTGFSRILKVAIGLAVNGRYHYLLHCHGLLEYSPLVRSRPWRRPARNHGRMSHRLQSAA